MLMFPTRIKVHGEIWPVLWSILFTGYFWHLKKFWLTIPMFLFRYDNSCPLLDGVGRRCKFWGSYSWKKIVSPFKASVKYFIWEKKGHSGTSPAGDFYSGLPRGPPALCLLIYCLQDAKGWTALFHAVYSGHIEVLDTLIKFGGSTVLNHQVA